MRHLLTIALLGAMAVAPAAAADCNLQLATSVPIAIDSHGGAVVPMSIGPSTVHLLIDTAGVDSMLTETTVKTLHLQTNALGHVSVRMFGGARIENYALAHDIALGNLKAPAMRFLVMPDGRLAQGNDGTLAPDVLRAYDDDFDFGAATLNLVSFDHCPGEVVYWTHEPHTEIKFILDGPHIVFPVMLDGKEVTAEIDTGASRSIFSLEGAERLFGFDEKSPLLTTDKAWNGAARQYPFKALSFGGVTVTNPNILLVPDDVARLHRDPRLIIGIGVLRQLHLYIAYHEKKLYVTAAGTR